jgi:hypothetical protein
VMETQMMWKHLDFTIYPILFFKEGGLGGWFKKSK